MNLVDPQVDDYLAAFAKSDDPVLLEMEEIARKRDFPIVGPQVGRMLAVLARTLGARSVVELGSGFGYSAIWFLRGMHEGRVVMTEGSAENVKQAERFLWMAGLEGRFQANVGDGLVIAERLHGPVDIVFCDIDKRDYPKALPIARRLLRPGGLFIVDNLLWNGKVLERARAADADTEGILQLTHLLRNASDFATTIVPVRDGVAVSVKL